MLQEPASAVALATPCLGKGFNFNMLLMASLGTHQTGRCWRKAAGIDGV